MPALHISSDNERVAVATWDQVLVTVWRCDVDGSDLLSVDRAQQRLIRELGGFASLAIIGPSALQTSAEARDEAARISKRGEDKNRGIAVVIAQHGFAGAAVRAAVTAIHLLSRTKVPQRAFGDLDPAASYIHQRLGATNWTPQQLARALAPLVPTSWRLGTANASGHGAHDATR